ncbi:MAG: HEAT repeat domain-containing protein, partial [Elusimicrobiota bacterium]
SVVATLIESLKDARWQVRAAVINTLGTFSDYEDTCGIIVKSLEKMINDEASEVRLATITNLANFYSSKYTKKITEILKLKTEDPLPVVALVAKKLEKAYNQKAVLLSRNSSKLAAIGFVITTVLAGIGISAASYLFLASKQAGKENVATVKRLELLSKYANLAATNMNADLERMSRSPQDMLTKYLFDDAVKGFKANLGGSDEQSKLRMVYYYTAACKAFQSNMDEAENYMDTAKGLK